MNKRKALLCILVILLIILIIVLAIVTKNKKKDIGYNPNVKLEDIKEDKGITGSNDIYEMVEEYDGRKVLRVKPEYLFKVALLGLYQKENNLGLIDSKISIEDMDNNYKIAKTYIIKKEGGVIVLPNEQKIVLDFISANSKIKYQFDENNCLQVPNDVKEEEISDFDKKLIENIKSNSNTIIITYGTEYYSIDDVTGDVVKYPFVDLDPYIDYDAVRYENYEIRFVNPQGDTSFLVN